MIKRENIFPIIQLLSSDLIIRIFIVQLRHSRSLLQNYLSYVISPDDQTNVADARKRFF